MFCNQRCDHRDDSRDEKAGRGPQRVDAPQTGHSRDQQEQQAGDVADQPEHHDSSPTDPIGDNAPQRRPNQNAGSVYAAEKADVTANFVGVGAGQH